MAYDPMDITFTEESSSAAEAGSAGGNEPQQQPQQQQQQLPRTIPLLDPTRQRSKNHIQSIRFNPGSNAAGISDCAFTFYDRVFTLSNRDDLEMLLLPPNHNRMMAMILYNMGVNHHEKGIRTGQSNELAIASQLYRLAYFVIETATEDFEFDDILFLLLGLYNNMGHVHAYFCNQDETRRCLQWLQQALSAHHWSSIFSDEERRFFLPYVLVSPDQQLSTSPAA